MSSKISNQTILEQLNWRYAVKKFDTTKKISNTDWNTLAESFRLTPSSYGLQPWRFYVVQDVSLREQLRAASWKQSQVTDCSHYVVMTYKVKMDIDHIQKHIDRIVEIRGVPVESLDLYKKGMIGDLLNGPRSQVIEHWAQKQCYIAMGFVMHTAAMLGIDCCPMEGLDPAAYDRLLHLEGTGWATAAAIAFGYRHADDSFAKNKKVRFEAEDIFKYL